MIFFSLANLPAATKERRAGVSAYALQQTFLSDLRIFSSLSCQLAVGYISVLAARSPRLDGRGERAARTEIPSFLGFLDSTLFRDFRLWYCAANGLGRLDRVRRSRL